MWKEAEEKVQRNQKEAEKCAHEEKGKEKVCGTSVRHGALLTMFVQEIIVLTSDNDTGSQQPKWKR